MVLKKNKANFWLRCGRCCSPYSSTSCTIAHMFCTFQSHTTNNCQSIMDHLFINDTFANFPFVFARLQAGVLRYRFMTIKHKLLTFLLALNWLPLLKLNITSRKARNVVLQSTWFLQSVAGMSKVT